MPASVKVCATVPLNVRVDPAALAVITPVLLIGFKRDSPSVKPFKLNVFEANDVVSEPILALACRVIFVLATATVITPLVGVAAGGSSLPVLIAVPLL